MILDTVHAANSPFNDLLKSDAMKDALLRAAAKLQAAAPKPEPSPAPQAAAMEEKDEKVEKDEKAEKDQNVAIDDSYKPNANPAVERCIQAYQRTRAEAEKAGRKDSSCIEAAENAFRLAIPPLDSPESVPNFIACVTRGMLNGSIPTKDASRYLYAAQVAQTASLESKSGPRPGRPSGRTPYPPSPYPYPETFEKPKTNI